MKLGTLLKRPVVRAYWWNGVNNFGDAIAPFLLTRFADLKVEWSPVASAEVVSIGSVLEHIPSNWTGHIVGSGLLREQSKLKFDPYAAKILALRGPLSARGISGDFALGDPALLANELIEHQEKKWDLGIVPHWQDGQLAARFKSLIPAKYSCKVITPWDDPLTVIEEIAACRRIVTSSLHGMVVADAIGGIPRRVEVCDNLAADGGMFKFQDYSASIKTPLEIGKMTEPERNRIDDAKFQIYDAFRELGKQHAKG
jgi:hypothetical protein